MVTYSREGHMIAERNIVIDSWKEVDEPAYGILPASATMVFLLR